jgi:hypothetical protein
MVDQPTTNQTKLSPEEELDVLEAVYKIGKEKGLDLLRPEQIHKLTETGRVKQKNIVDTEVLVKIASEVTKQLLVRLGGDNMMSLSLSDKSVLFEQKYGLTPAHFFLYIEKNLEQVRDNV